MGTESTSDASLCKKNYQFIGKIDQEIQQQFPQRVICLDDFSPGDAQEVVDNQSRYAYVLAYDHWNIDLDIEKSLVITFTDNIVVEASIVTRHSGDWLKEPLQ